MISPIWEDGGDLKHKGRTKFTLRLSESSEGSLEKLCESFESLHPSVIFGLRKLRKVIIRFQNVQGRDYEMSFYKSFDTSRGITKIISKIAGKTIKHAYRTFARDTEDMPVTAGRVATMSTIRIGLPVSAQSYDIPETSELDQNIFAFLPIMQVQQIPFLIHADFLLTGGRQAVTDNAWNRKLREAIADLFVDSVEQVVLEDNELSYRWHSYIPTQSVVGFWEPFSASIQRLLSVREIFYSRAGTLHPSSAIRFLPKHVMHEGEPLLSDCERAWRFVSARYNSPYWPTFELLGVKSIKHNDIVDLIGDDLSSSESRIQKTDLSDGWHDSFLALVKHVLDQNCSSRTEMRLYKMKIVPVRVEEKLKWWRPGQVVYFPTVVEEGTGFEQVKLQMPTNIGFVVLHPDAAVPPTRLQIYGRLGVSRCSIEAICEAIEGAQLTSGSSFTSDLISHPELLFWHSHKISPQTKDTLKGLRADGEYQTIKGSFLRSDQTYHAERLLNLQDNSQYKEHFLDSRYQRSPVATRSRDDVTWEQWLCKVAGARWFPPLENPENSDELYWMIETIRSQNSHIFVPLIQEHWLKEYGETCQSNGKIKQALLECKVPCRNGSLEELGKTWFPKSSIITAAQKYGIEKKLPILALPDSAEEHSISQWPSLRDLKVQHSRNLTFYREALSLLSDTGDAPQISVTKMGSLYKMIGACAGLKDQKNLRVFMYLSISSITNYLQDDFRNESLVWDPSNQKWCTLNDCIWESSVPLTCKFVLTSEYAESHVRDLFQTLLSVGNVTLDVLVDELDHLQQQHSSDSDDASATNHDTTNGDDTDDDAVDDDSTDHSDTDEDNDDDDADDDANSNDTTDNDNDGDEGNESDTTKDDTTDDDTTNGEDTDDDTSNEDAILLQRVSDLYKLIVEILDGSRDKERLR